MATKQQSIARQQQYNQASENQKQKEQKGQNKITQSRSSSKRNSQQSLSSSKQSSRQSNQEMKPIQISQPIQNSIIAQVNQKGQPTVQNTKIQEQKPLKKKQSFIELLCRCFLGSSQNSLQQQNDEKSTQEEIEHKQLGPQFEHAKGKKTLILDLDETLVHSSFQPMGNSDYTLSIKVQNIPFTIHVKKRPGVEYFLEKASEYFEVVIYTASLAEYADPVCDLIDPKRYVSYRLFRENCTNYQGLFVKDLSKIGRDMKDILIVDNSETSFLFQPENAIQISNFFQDDNDRELFRMLPFLQFLSEVQDVRTTKSWMEKYLNQDYIEYISMKGEHIRFNKRLQLKKQRSLLQHEGSTVALMQQQTASISRDDSQVMINQISTKNTNINSKNNTLVENNLNLEAQNNQSKKPSVINDESNSPDEENLQKNNYNNSSKTLTASGSTQSGIGKKYKKKDLQIQVPQQEDKIKQQNELNEDQLQQQMLQEYEQKIGQQQNNLNSVRNNKLESTRKLLEKGTPRTDDYFVHKTCPDEEYQVKDPNRLNKSFEKQRYDIGMFNLNSPIAQKDFIDFLKEPIQTSPKLNKISQYFQASKNSQPPPSNKYCDNFKLKLLMQQTQQIQEQEIEVDPSSIQIDQIILDRNHNNQSNNKDYEFDKQVNPNKKCEIIDFTDDNIKY
ncbi:NLI interacting factor-like phosphatase (macronuclear) [Tetrahymena thermophila SB210]|uniref:NLI interacting factor-like phosphatase n=1 Tax=Tetrahymena thermophila (strain SB210) TaxID=312017 RepID=I7LW20_TETTS|nr:NLI interacting factor-like phosphatase [Tetrahymena thermophila SB210]EAS00600.2 NLI interacting factor-like phosphatase [Tetrahymena thermophila SB210]|eukprot:XP_001020845.2 NLI interacting factor-like phosphatase [Tetrahymena thermophila SB210]